MPFPFQNWLQSVIQWPSHGWVIGTSAITLASDSELVFGCSQGPVLMEEYTGKNVKDTRLTEPCNQFWEENCRITNTFWITPKWSILTDGKFSFPWTCPCYLLSDIGLHCCSHRESSSEAIWRKESPLCPWGQELLYFSTYPAILNDDLHIVGVHLLSLTAICPRALLGLWRKIESLPEVIYMKGPQNTRLQKKKNKRLVAVPWTHHLCCFCGALSIPICSSCLPKCHPAFEFRLKATFLPCDLNHPKTLRSFLSLWHT